MIKAESLETVTHTHTHTHTHGIKFNKEFKKHRLVINIF